MFTNTTSRIRSVLFAAIVVALVALAACGSGGSPTSSTDSSDVPASASGSDEDVQATQVDDSILAAPPASSVVVDGVRSEVDGVEISLEPIVAPTDKASLYAAFDDGDAAVVLEIDLEKEEPTSILWLIEDGGTPWITDQATVTESGGVITASGTLESSV